MSELKERLLKNRIKDLEERIDRKDHIINGCFPLILLVMLLVFMFVLNSVTNH